MKGGIQAVDEPIVVVFGSLVFALMDDDSIRMGLLCRATTASRGAKSTVNKGRFR